MKTGKTIVQLAAEIQRQMEAKKDFVAPRSLMSMALVAERDTGEAKTTPVIVLKNGNGGAKFPLRDLAHDQLAARLGLPRAYYDKMRAEAPALLATNVNHWLQHGDGDKAMMVRTLDGQARAFLSDRYRPLDNSDLAEAVLPALAQANLDVMSCEITERRLYIKAVDKKVTRELQVKGGVFGDGGHTIVRLLAPAITISNSEVGSGALSIMTGLYDGFCTNLAFFGERSMRKYHAGGKLGYNGQDGFYELLSDKTRRLTDAALWAQTRDLVTAALDRVKFDALVDTVAACATQQITGHVPEVVEVTAKHFGFTDTEKASVLQHLIKGGDLTRFGLYNAVTRTAEDLPDYDRATQFERFGGEVIELDRRQWQRIAEAELVAA